ncbi:MAG: erythromycin esterase family protein [Nitriliruptoraceae bacterium]
MNPDPRRRPDEVAELATPLRSPADLDPLLDRIGDARLVLVGEASHGTHEYYHWRAELTKRLIAERGFTVVAVEGDWPDCHRIDRAVRTETAGSVREVLQTFERWPTWMWANAEVEGFATWLKERNLDRAPAAQVGFYGLDVYSLWASLRVIIDYLDVHDGQAALTARRAWSCLEPYAEDPQEYALATRVVPTSCEEEVVALLTRLQQDAGVVGDDAEGRFQAEQNAAVAADAERYYRAMVRGGASSWNIRDRHMVDTLDRVLAHRGPHTKAVVWAHNTHVGDARATDMAAAGMVNVGQLVRERYGGDDVVIVGAGSYRGEVIAAREWGLPFEVLPVPEAPAGSLEELLHRAAPARSQFVFPDRQVDWLDARLGHRAIGVVYRPERERRGQYVPTRLGRRYDAFWFLDTTAALRPVPPEVPQPDREQETYPFGD